MEHVDIVNMRSFKPNSQAIDIALPVLAYECEASIPIEGSVDAYEEAVLKLISLGLGQKGMANALSAPESLVSEVISHLEDKEYVARSHAKPWHLTEAGYEYLSGSLQERMSSESQYGYMFVNAIKKEVLPYFYQGDVGKISLFALGYDGQELPQTLGMPGGRSETFAPLAVKQSRLKAAYQRYFRSLDVARRSEDGEITIEEARDEVMMDPFADLDALDEDVEYGTEEEGRQTPENVPLTANMTVRMLRKDPTKLYLRMRIVIDPKVPGGYRAESPFDLGGIDDGYFLRQIQWLEQSGCALLEGEDLHGFITKEIGKLGRLYAIPDKDFSVFVIEKMPSFRLCETRVPTMFDDMRHIYASMQSQPSLIEKENIVGNISRLVAERLLNLFFSQIDVNQLDQVRDRAERDVRRDRSYHNEAYKAQLCNHAGFVTATIGDDIRPIVKCIKRSNGRGSNGNNIFPKVVNLLVVYFYLGTTRIGRLFSSFDNHDELDKIHQISIIRNRASHDTDEPFTSGDYDQYMAYVFTFINYLAGALWEE